MIVIDIDKIHKNQESKMQYHTKIRWFMPLVLLLQLTACTMPEPPRLTKTVSVAQFVPEQITSNLHINKIVKIPSRLDQVH